MVDYKIPLCMFFCRAVADTYAMLSAAHSWLKAAYSNELLREDCLVSLLPASITI